MVAPLTYEWDEEKAKVNEAERDIHFSAVLGFDWESAVVVEDTRKHYGEQRFKALGKIGNRLYVLAFTVRSTRIRVISLFKANAREVKRYDSITQEN